MAIKNTRDELAQELGIPSEYIDPVVVFVHKKLGRSVPNKVLLDEIRRDPKIRNQFLKIYEKIRDTNATITKNPPPQKTNITELAATVKRRLNFPITYKEIREVIHRYEPDSLNKDKIVDQVKLYQIAKQLNTTEEIASDLPRLIKERIIRSITYDIILEWLKTPGFPRDIEKIPDFIEDEWAAAAEIARLLDISDEDAWQFVQNIWSKNTYSVPRQETIYLLGQLPEENRNQKSVVELIDYQFISQQFNISLEEASKLVTRVKEQIGIPNPRQQIVDAIPFLPKESSESRETQLNILVHIAGTLEWSVREASQLIDQVQKDTGRELLYEDIGRAFNELTKRTISVQNLVERINEREAAQLLNIEPSELRIFLNEISDELGGLVTPAHVLEINSITETVSLERVREYFWKKQFPIPQIASAMDISPEKVPSILRQVREECLFEVKDDEIYSALVDLPQVQRDVKGLLNSLDARWIATKLDIDIVDAPNPLARIRENFGIEGLSIKRVILAWDVLPKANRTFPELQWLLQTSERWQKNEQEVLRTIHTAIDKSIVNTTLAKIWPMVQQLDPNLQNVDGLVTFLNVQHLLQNDAPTPENLNDISLKITKWESGSDIWDHQARSCTPDQLTLSDINYFLWLIDRLYHPFLFMSQKLSENVKWISKDFLSFVLNETLPSNTRRTHQKTRLHLLSQRCWYDIGSQKRKYQIPSNGRAEILVPEIINELIELKSVRFFQEYTNAPGLFVQFNFRDGDIVGFLKIQQDGKVDGFHKLFQDDWFQALIESIAFSHYRDLVVPTQQKNYQTQRSKRSKSGMKEKIISRKFPKTFPAKRYQKKQYKISDWYESQEIIRHSVRGHTRWVGKHFVADWIKQQQALRAGVWLARGETWVIEHERGNPQQTPIKLDGEDLVEHTVFYPPPRASNELIDILS